MTDSPPPPVAPDTKDWTWVLERPCIECGFDATTVDPTDVARLTRDNAAAWASVLGDAGEVARIRDRPAPDRWSPLEYACHVRDVFAIFDHRLDLMLTEDGPRFPNWDQDETAVTDRYDRADPATVAVELAAAASRLADRFDSVAGDQWTRTGHRSDGASFTVASFALYFVHDPIHHLHDVA